MSVPSVKKKRNTVDSSISKRQCSLKSNNTSDRNTNSPSSSKRANSSIMSNDSMMATGRSFHGVTNSAYWFPNDNEEMDRLVGQHFAVKSLFEGNIRESILKGLDMENKPAMVLDVGCGPGTWIMDVATRYPQSEFIGIDLCDVFPNRIRPPNVTFQVGNVLESLPFPDNTFDFVNMRLFVIAFKTHEWPQALKEVYRVLKPGGYVQMIECGMLERGSEYVKFIGGIFKEFIENRGQEPYIASKLPSLLESEQFRVVDSITKDAHIGHPNPLSREFLSDVISIIKTARIPFQEILKCNSEQFNHIIEKFNMECLSQPEAIWSFSVCVGQK
ncbi:S-adenosyl-L-methionine-dependent methyltransferase [Choanephora cucurbitarum]|nr:S-adenosyl-L-methionine-dependent methyltransferase [Choanephora cucurbitarum]